MKSAQTGRVQWFKQDSG